MHLLPSPPWGSCTRTPLPSCCGEPGPLPLEEAPASPAQAPAPVLLNPLPTESLPPRRRKSWERSWGAFENPLTPPTEWGHIHSYPQPWPVEYLLHLGSVLGTGHLENEQSRAPGSSHSWCRRDTEYRIRGKLRGWEAYLTQLEHCPGKRTLGWSHRAGFSKELPCDWHLWKGEDRSGLGSGRNWVMAQGQAQRQPQPTPWGPLKLK